MGALCCAVLRQQLPSGAKAASVGAMMQDSRAACMQLVLYFAASCLDALTVAAVTRVLTCHSTHHRSCRCPGRRRCRPSSRSLGQSSSLRVRAATCERAPCMRCRHRLCTAANGAVCWQGASMLTRQQVPVQESMSLGLTWVAVCPANGSRCVATCCAVLLSCRHPR